MWLGLPVNRDEKQLLLMIRAGEALLKERLVVYDVRESQGSLGFGWSCVCEACGKKSEAPTV